MKERKLWVLLKCPFCKKPLLIDNLDMPADPVDGKHLIIRGCEHFTWEPFSLDDDLPLYAIIAIKQYGNMWVLQPTLLLKEHLDMLNRPYRDIKPILDKLYQEMVKTAFA